MARRLTFQVFHLSLEAQTLAEFQGPMLHEITDIRVTGQDTVNDVRNKLLEAHPEIGRENHTVTLFFCGRPMQTDRLFFAEHFVALPAWFQVLVHTGDVDSVVARVRALSPEQ
eukprot:TRINITY_DN5805_c0_g2_i3.p2 TRINITY_DN5805_c0_g2~~TRINITY_DN5805_c0_g2_i3.p2  ORF type:complete len:113 (+),score=29.55 TRINITY_DN5805_c0_g2_i3:100-438(+)